MSTKFQLLIKTKIPFLALSLSDVAFIMLINIKMPTIVGILTFMSSFFFFFFSSFFFLLFALILYVPSTIFQLNRDGSSWVEPVLNWDKCVLLKDHNAVSPVRLEPATPRSRIKHSTTDFMRFRAQLS